MDRFVFFMCYAINFILCSSKRDMEIGITLSKVCFYAPA